MESGLCLRCFNCCFFNCFNSIHMSIYQLLTSLIGIAANSAILTLSKRVFGSSNFLFSTQIINISFFFFFSTLSSILLFLKKMEKINKGCYHKFGWRSSQIYSFFSKLLIIMNVISFFYLISFTPFLTQELSINDGKELFNETLFKHIGNEIVLFLKYNNQTFHCGNFSGDFECIIDDVSYKGKDENNFGDVFLLLFYSILSGLIMFLNGRSYSSDSKRIKFLCKGKISLELKPIEVVSSFCTREKKFDSLNLLFCYRATVFNVEALISTFSFINFIFSIFLIVLTDKYLPIQGHYISYIVVLIPLFISIICFLSGMCFEKCCCKNRGPFCKKISTVIVVILIICYLPMEISSLVISVGVLSGNVKFRAECNDYAYNIDYPELYKSICSEDYKNKYFLITLKGCSINYILYFFICISIEIILLFYLIVLMLNYIGRAVPENGVQNRAYETVMYSVEENGEKICIGNIKIGKELENNNINENGIDIKSEKAHIYKRNAPSSSRVPAILNAADLEKINEKEKPKKCETRNSNINSNKNEEKITSDYRNLKIKNKNLKDELSRLKNQLNLLLDSDKI